MHITQWTFIHPFRQRALTPQRTFSILKRVKTFISKQVLHLLLVIMFLNLSLESI